MTDEYPEHEKLHAVQDKLQVCVELIDWLRDEQGFHFSRWDDEREEFFPVHERTETLLARFFGLDLNKINQEKEAMLEVLRESNPQ